MNIAVDIDGVIWDIMDVFLELYNEKYKENIKYNDVNEWYFFPQEKFDVIYLDTLKRIDEYRSLDSIINHYLFLLMGKHEVKILTKEQNPVELLKEKLETLGIREGFEYLEVIKLEIKDSKLNYEFDLYIDDCPLMVDEIKKYPDRILLLYEQPWNLNCKESDNVFKVKDWYEVVDKIEEIENDRTI